MAILFLITGIIVCFFAMAFDDGEFRNPIFKWICFASGGALIISFFNGNEDFKAYLFFISVPALIYLYMLISGK